MEIQFLGTSSGTPTKTRNVSGLALRSFVTRGWYLVDCGEGTQHRILHTSLSLATLQAIFITHIHGDHCYGLPGLLASAGLLNRADPLLIVGPPEVRGYVECVLDTTRLRLPYALEFIAIEDGAVIGGLQDFDVRVTAMSHRVPSYAFSFTERAVENKLDVEKLKREGVVRGPDWGRLQQGEPVIAPDGRVLQSGDYLLPRRKPRKIIVGGDNDAPERLHDEAASADVLVHEATYTEDMLKKVGPAPQHSCARQVAQAASEAGLVNLVLTHFSPRYQEDGGTPALAEIEAEARQVYSGNLFLASDLDRYILDRQGVLTKEFV